MTYALAWMPDVLRAAGLKVATVDGWLTRGRGDVGSTLGVLCHHTAGQPTGNMPALKRLVTGRSNLAGPLAQLGLGRDGTFYVVAAGLANHAGPGAWNGVTRGNRHLIGIEAENTGRSDDPWPDVQMDAYRRGVAALLKHLNLSANACAGHKEWPLPRGRKPDPSFDMQLFRNQVAAIMAGTAPVRPPIAATEPEGLKRPTVRRGSTSELVRDVQRALGINADGQFGARTEAALRVFQRRHQLVPDGIVGPSTWRALDAAKARPG